MGREELLDLPKLAKDDTFVFGCSQCGKCCRERHDLILNCLDLYKIAKYLNKSIQGIISEYCEHYLGGESHIPIVKIKPTNYKNSCPFLKNKCSIHSVKPAVCALYPLGRMLNGQTGEMSYIIQDVPCGNKKETHTVREWLGEFNMLEEESFTIAWQNQLYSFCLEIMEFYGKINQVMADMMYMVLFTKLYLDYDITKDLLPQFENNCWSIKCFLAEIKADVLEK